MASDQDRNDADWAAPEGTAGGIFAPTKGVGHSAGGGPGAAGLGASRPPLK